MIAVDADVAAIATVVDAVVVAVVEDTISNFEVSAFSVQALPNDCAVYRLNPVADFPTKNDRKNP